MMKSKGYLEQILKEFNDEFQAKIIGKKRHLDHKKNFKRKKCVQLHEVQFSLFKITTCAQLQDRNHFFLITWFVKQNIS